MELKNLISLFEEKFGVKPQVKKLTGGGSSREYYRLSGEGKSAIGVVGSDLKENEVFERLASCLEKQRINVPHLLAISPDKRYYLLEDLGDVSLFSLLAGPRKMELAKKALSELIKIQTLPEQVWINEVGFYPFSERLVKWDLNYFKYDFLKPAGILFDEEKLEDDFDNLSKVLSSPSMITGLMYRDFQSRNIMVKEDKLWFIDFQGARKGPLLYDAISFIWQAKAPFTFEEREALGEYYMAELEEKGYSINDISNQLKIMQIFRNLQVLGAYGFRGLIERKAHFLESIPGAVANLNYLNEKGVLNDYPELKRISHFLYHKYLETPQIDEKALTLQVYSFSYKKGYPEDNSGNGGGFMFDCRAIHNPGRYEAYKALNGKDTEVIEFLEKNSEAKDFVEKALAIVSSSVERYLQRGFTSLQVGFGCTGGQHRSVYCAERFAKSISALYPAVKVRIIHREQSPL